MELRGEFWKVEDVLKEILDRNKNIGTLIKQNRALQLWGEIVEPGIAKATEPINIRGGKLFIKTESPILANELSLQEENFKNRINRIIGEQIVKKIVFKSGKIIKAKKENKNNICIERKLSKKTLEKIKEVSGQIRDPELRVLMERFLKQVAKRSL